MFKTMIQATILGTLLATSVGCGLAPTMDVQGGSKNRSSGGISQTMNQTANSEVRGGYSGGALNNNAVAVNVGSQRASGNNINQRLDQEANAKVKSSTPISGLSTANGNAVSVNVGKQQASNNNNKRRY
ncbi:hypothetical protein J7643_19845 [bacterium]|nr:hypothetical protein [bacterium]